MPGIVRLVGLLLVAMYCLGSSSSNADSARVIEVREGDLLVVMSEGRMQKVRLYGVICPVRGQPHHERARALSSYLSIHRNVELTSVYRDGEGVANALVRLEGTKYYLNERLVGYGMAWVKPKECRAALCEQWRGLQELARKNAIGLWATMAVPPWEWAKEQRMEIHRRQEGGAAGEKQ